MQIRRNTRKFHKKKFHSCRCSTTFPVEQETLNKNVWQTLDSYLCMQEHLVKDNGHSLVLVLRKSGTPSNRTVTRNLGQYCGKDVGGIRRKRMSNFPCYDSIVQRSTQARTCKLSTHLAADLETIETIFRIIVSANQLSHYGAVAEMCEEYEPPSRQIRAT